jgi:hypothetical protein
MMTEFEIFIVDLPLGLPSSQFLSGFLTNILLTFIVSTMCAKCIDHLALR